MTETQLLIRGGSHLAAHLNDVVGFIGRHIKPQSSRIDQTKTVSAISGIHCDSPDSFDLKWRIKAIRKRCHILNSDLSDCPIRTTGRCLNQASRSFQVDHRFRLLHGQDAGLEQNRGDTDRV